VIVRKKDVKALCDQLALLAGPFALCAPDGKVVYAVEGMAGPVPDAGPEVTVDGAVVGYISGPAEHGRTVASVVGLFLKNTEERRSLTDHTLQKYREISFLSQINKVLSSSMGVLDVLCEVTRMVHEIIDVESCSVMVPDTRSGKFVLKVISGRAVSEPLELAITEGIAGRVLKSGAPAIVNDPAQHPDFVTTGSVEIRSLLCLPLTVKDQTIGIITLRNKKSGMFTSEDETLLASICVLVAEVLENARLLEEKIRNEKFSAIGQMAAGIIHDIKNPMTTIKGFAGLLGDLEFTKEERKEYSTMIVGEVDRLVNMVEDLLAFAKGFKSKLAIEQTDVPSYFTGLLPYLEKDMVPRGIEVVLSMDYSGSFRVDREKFKRVLFNIAGNAREALHDGGRFLVLIRPSDGGVEVVLSDNGGGIPEDILETIFEPFVTKGKKSGTGLGLAITKKIVDEHGGSIRALNGNYSGREGFEGANFAIVLPGC